MAKFRHKILNADTGANTYKSEVTGNRYLFRWDAPTEINNEKDVEFFRNHPDFQEVNGGFTPADTLRHRLIGIDGVSPKLADEILKKFDTEEKIRNASVDELKAIKGIGLVVAAKIKEAIK